MKPTVISAEALFEAHREGRLPDDAVKADGDMVLLNVKCLPVINRQQIKAVQARNLFANEWELTKLKAAQKVYNSYLTERGEKKKSASFEEQYGADAAAWLKEAGFTDYSGFSPKQVQAESTDHYVAKEMDVKIASYSAIPSLNDYKKQVAKGKLTPSAQLMDDSVKAVEAFLASPDGKDADTILSELGLK